jgi:polyhydroxyalkanoate synthesis regulator protein
MESFARNQNELRQKFADALGGKLGYRDFEQLTRQNLQMFDRAMKMFSPFGMGAWTGQSGEPAASNARTADKPEAQNPSAPARRKDEIEELKDQVEAMRRQLAELAQRK